MGRNFYDITLSTDTMGNCTPDDLTRFCEEAEKELSDILDADVRVRFGSGGESYTFIGSDNYTCQGPLTEAMRDGLAAVYEQSERWVK